MRADPRGREPMKSNGDVGVSGGAERGEPSGSRAERSRLLNTAPMNHPAEHGEEHPSHTTAQALTLTGRQSKKEHDDEQQHDERDDT